MSLHTMQVIDSFKPEAGSLAPCVHGLLRALGDRSVQTVTFVGQRETITDTYTESSQVRPFERAQAREEMRRMNVVHIHGWGYEAARIAAREARRAGRPYVITPCGALTRGLHRQPDWGDRVRGWFGGDSLVRNATALVAQNKREADSLALRTSGERTHIIPYGLHCDEFQTMAHENVPLQTDSGDRVLLVLAPIEPTYGCVLLLKSMAELGPAGDGWHLVLAGEKVGDWHKQMAAAVQRKGGAGRVTFASAPSINTQRAWLARAAALAAIGLHIHSPVSIIQALTCGVPVLASDVVVPDGLEDSLMVCPPERGAIRTALRDFLGLTNEVRGKLALDGGEGVRSRLDWSVLIERYLEIYNRAIKREELPTAASMA